MVELHDTYIIFLGFILIILSIAFLFKPILGGSNIIVSISLILSKLSSTLPLINEILFILFNDALFLASIIASSIISMPRTLLPSKVLNLLQR